MLRESRVLPAEYVSQPRLDDLDRIVDVARCMSSLDRWKVVHQKVLYCCGTLGCEFVRGEFVGLAEVA